VKCVVLYTDVAVSATSNGHVKCVVLYTDVAVSATSNRHVLPLSSLQHVHSHWTLARVHRFAGRD